MTVLSRREALKLGAVASLLASTGCLPLLEEEECVESAALDDATLPAAGHLETHPLFTAAAVRESHVLEFDIVLWDKTVDGKILNSVAGSLAVTRNLTRGSVGYSVRHELKDQIRPIVLTAELVCNDDALNTVRTWACEYETQSGLAYSETGAIEGGALVLDGKPVRGLPPASLPVIADWTLPSLLATNPPTCQLDFDLLEECSKLKYRQSLIRRGVVDVEVAGETVELEAWSHHGDGLLPTHYLIDDARRVQLVTGGTVSFALRSVA